MGKIKVLLVRPKFDLATEHSHAWAEEVKTELIKSSIQLTDLSETKANRQATEEKLAEDPQLFIFYGHGNTDRLLGQDGETVINLQNDSLLAQKLVYTMACSSASTLGTDAVQKGAICYFGYTQPFGFVLGATENAFKASANSGIIAMISQNCTSGEAKRIMVNEFTRWVDHYTTGEGITDPNAVLAAAWLIRDRDLLVLLGDQNARLVKQEEETQMQILYGRVLTKSDGSTEPVIFHPPFKKGTLPIVVATARYASGNAAIVQVSHLTNNLVVFWCGDYTGIGYDRREINWIAMGEKD